MRAVSALACIAVTAALPAFAGAAGRTLSFTVKTREGPTTLQAHPPAGGVGDTFVSSLVLKNAGIPQFGEGKHAQIGSMQFIYTIRRQCTSDITRKRCVATADFGTVSTLPGGTVLASGKAISIATPSITIPVTGGTGRYAGARGTITISPMSTKLSTFTLKLP